MSRLLLAAILLGLAALLPATANASELGQRHGAHAWHGGVHWGHPWGFRGPVVIGVPVLPPPPAYAVPVPVAAYPVVVPIPEPVILPVP